MPGMLLFKPFQSLIPRNELGWLSSEGCECIQGIVFRKVNFDKECIPVGMIGLLFLNIADNLLISIKYNTTTFV